jgi:bifunctional NMN adenylyltransferase/nudix hydrolase
MKLTTIKNKMLTTIFKEFKMEKIKVAVYIGRFAPFHKGHKAVVSHCNKQFDKTIVLVGSTNKRRSHKNPFDFDVIERWIQENSDDNTTVRPLKDYIYNDQKWISQVEDIVYSIYNPNKYEFTIVGHDKDASSYYLSIFPTWQTQFLPSFEEGISATDIRNEIFNENTTFHYIKKYLTEDVIKYISFYRKTNAWKDIMQEIKWLNNEKELFKDYPYKETLKFNCSDAVVVCEGNVLLIERKTAPGKGTLALPGGFVNRQETYKEAAIRELYEETNLRIPEKVLNGSLKRSKIFDSPKRNFGIPRISNAFYFEVEPDKIGKYPKLPKIKAADDAVNARWVSLAEVKYLQLFDDHADIIDNFVNSF